MRVPKVAKVSRARMASWIAPRVFFSAQTPVMAPGFTSVPVIQPGISPSRRFSTLSSAPPWLPM